MRHGLRLAAPDDRSALRAVYASSRADELALTDWTEAQRLAFIAMQFDAQWRHYTLHHPQSVCQAIVLGDAAVCGPDAGRVVGRLWVDRSAGHLHVLDIALLPEVRGQGLGTLLLRQLMAEAASQARPLTISVEIHNPARHLYGRLGFQSQGEVQGIYQRMAWHPAVQRSTKHQECLT